MRSKLFLAFLAIVLVALASDFIFERLIIKDFDDYAMGVREDRIYWLMASAEGGRLDRGWDMESLRDTLHWAMMLGWDAEVRDTGGRRVLASMDVFETLQPAMKRRMEALVHIHEPEGEFEEYPLYMGGKEIGALHVRPLKREGFKEKEAIYKKRGKDFLLISFLIAGGGALLLSFALSLYLARPIRRLRRAAEKVAGGDLSARAGAVSDDEIGRLTRTFDHMVESLQREEALRKRLTANIAHELRTPMTVIKANLEAVMDDIKGKEEGLPIVKAELERLVALVEGIEDMTKAEASFFARPELVNVRLRGLLEGVLQGMEPLFKAKGLELALKGPAGLDVVTDPEKLELILRNILSNALRHTGKGGVTVSYGTDGKDFFIEAADTGEGIPEEEMARIFDRFYRGAGSTGIGLGLAIAKELADVMGGKIEVKSKPGAGTVFRVVLPLKGHSPPP